MRLISMLLVLQQVLREQIRNNKFSNHLLILKSPNRPSQVFFVPLAFFLKFYACHYK